jgi:hypothetical protein
MMTPLERLQRRASRLAVQQARLRTLIDTDTRMMIRLGVRIHGRTKGLASVDRRMERLIDSIAQLTRQQKRAARASQTLPQPSPAPAAGEEGLYLYTPGREE